MSDETRVALVTGGSGAIGSAVTRMLAARGMAVAVGYHRDQASAQQITTALPGAVAIQLDVGDPASVQIAFDQVRSLLGPVTVLVNAAGVVRDRPVVRMCVPDWDDVIRINLTGTFHCVRYALPAMLAVGFGRIVSIGSVGVVGLPGQANYAAAKAGIVGLTRSVAQETGRHGITANVVSPGLVKSRLTADMLGQLRDRFVGLAATGELVSAAEVAHAVQFCVEATAVTGQVINVDGGFSWSSQGKGDAGNDCELRPGTDRGRAAHATRRTVQRAGRTHHSGSPLLP